MAYIKNTWADNDIITAEKLNHIDEGIINSSVPIAQLTLESVSEEGDQLKLNITPYKIINNIFTFAAASDGETVEWSGGFFYILDNINSNILIYQSDFLLTNENDIYTLQISIDRSTRFFMAENLNSFFQESGSIESLDPVPAV